MNTERYNYSILNTLLQENIINQNILNSIDSNIEDVHIPELGKIINIGNFSIVVELKQKINNYKILMITNEAQKELYLPDILNNGQLLKISEDFPITLKKLLNSNKLKLLLLPMGYTYIPTYEIRILLEYELFNNLRYIISKIKDVMPYLKDSIKRFYKNNLEEIQELDDDKKVLAKIFRVIIRDTNIIVEALIKNGQIDYEIILDYHWDQFLILEDNKLKMTDCFIFLNYI